VAIGDRAWAPDSQLALDYIAQRAAPKFADLPVVARIAFLRETAGERYIEESHFKSIAPLLVLLPLQPRLVGHSPNQTSELVTSSMLEDLWVFSKRFRTDSSPALTILTRRVNAFRTEWLVGWLANTLLVSGVSRIIAHYAEFEFS
jgi:hypothetical protein